MKKISFLLCLLAAFGLYACTQDEVFVDRTPSKGLTAEIPTYQFEGNSTRVSISQDLRTYTWKNGDKIGIYYTSGTTYADAKFTLKQGGKSHGEFYNEAFSLKPNSTYYAFYPYDSNATVDAYPVDFTGQVQTANGSTDHIGARNYMSAVVNTDNSGSAFIAFQNQASVLQLALPIEEAGTYTGVTLSTAAADFITQGTLSMKTGSISSKAKSQNIKVSLGGGITLNEGDKLTVNVLVAPVNLTGKTFSVTLETGAKTYSFKELEGKNFQKGKAYKVECESGKIEETPYLTFTAEAEQTLRMSKAVETLEYSVNNAAWQTLGTTLVTFGGSNGNLRLRGKSSKGTANGNTDYSKIFFSNVTKVACTGDIRTLVDYENYKTANTQNARFCCLFWCCSSLISAPSLPAETLASYCYFQMFSGCSSLISAPSLPAETLASYCYYSMFQDCSSLISAPSLPAEKLTISCYSYMFYGCSSLMSAPSLPAKSLAGGCYQFMFYNCRSLISAPSLPAETLTSQCYRFMFSGCSSLTSAPSLPATTLAKDCYYFMFERCSSLTSAPSLPAKTLAESCYHSMFYGCSNLTSAPSLPAETLASSCYEYMFRDCSSLTSVPSSLPAPILADKCYYSMFYRCSNLTSAPFLPAETLAESCYYSMFYGCSNLTSAPSLPATTLAKSCYNSMFQDCSSLTSAPSLPAPTLAESCYYDMFWGCSKLNYIKMLATDISATDCLKSWANDVSSAGTFIKSKDATWDKSSTYVIPSGWTVQTE